MSGPIGKISIEGDIVYVDVEKAIGGQLKRIDLPQEVGKQIVKVLIKGVNEIKEEIPKEYYKSTIDNAIKGTKYEKMRNLWK